MLRHARWLGLAAGFASAVAVRGATVAEPAQALVDAAWSASGAPGLTAAVVRADGTTEVYAAGFRDADRTEPMPPNARMMAGSVGKTFVAALVWRLVERGALSPDDLVSKHLGDAAWFDRLPNADTITVRMLLNHTSGLMDHVRLPEFAAAVAAEPARHRTPVELLEFVFDREPLFPAGERFAYADTNYIVLGMLIERVTGEPFYNTAVRELIEPLGLTDTIAQTGAALPGLIEGVDRLGLLDMPEVVARDGVYSINPSWEWCGGGWVSSSPDLARWIRAYAVGDVLSAESRRAMRKGVSANTGPGDRYGPGLMIVRTPSGEAVGHLGFMPGYVTLALHFVERRTTVAVQINASSIEALRELRPLAAGLAASEPVPVSPSAR